MKLKATVKHGNGNACFTIQKEGTGVYYADLVYFVGDKSFLPPKTITLVKSVRQWTGSYDDEDLLNEIGKIIERSQFNSSPVLLPG